MVRGEHVDRAGEARHRGRNRPELMRALVSAVVDVVEVPGIAFGEKVTEQIGHAIRFATMIPAQIEHQRLGSRDEGHGRIVSGTDDFRMAEVPHVDVAYVTRQQLHAADAITLVGRSDAHLRDHLRDFPGGRFLVLRFFCHPRFYRRVAMAVASPARI